MALDDGLFELKEGRSLFLGLEEKVVGLIVLFVLSLGLVLYFIPVFLRFTFH